jgi:hypothetical protein
MDTWRTDLTHLPAFAPAFAPLSSWLKAIQGSNWPTLSQLNALAEHQNLRNAHGLPIRFTVQSTRCSQHDYEMSIYTTGKVPSRKNNWHDLFNALTWLAFPETKAALNNVHHAALPRGSNRSPASDAATLFDESGLVLVGEDDSIAHLLAARRWQEAWVQQRSQWQHLKGYIVGHAVLEKLLSPYPGITTKCLYIALPADSPLDQVDAAIAQRWQAATHIPNPATLFPVPILGIPGWWAENEIATFYANEKVFRPARLSDCEKIKNKS